jgi:hypothetical protein
MYISWHLKPFQRCTSQTPPLSLCLYVYFAIVATQGLGKYVTAAMNTEALVEELLDASFSTQVLCSHSGRCKVYCLLGYKAV